MVSADATLLILCYTSEMTVFFLTKVKTAMPSEAQELVTVIYCCHLQFLS